MVDSVLPEEILARFRSLSLERIGRVEAAWHSLVQRADDGGTPNRILHDLHSVKGDARAVEFAEVHLLCQKLEDLVTHAAQLDFQVSDDFDLVVTMATQFLSVLLRRKDGGPVGGIDLAGFVRQVEEVLREARSLAPERSRAGGPRTRSGPELAVDRLTEATRQRLAVAATTAYIEYLCARGTSRSRLRSLWHTLKQELGRMNAVPLAPLLERQVHAAQTLANDLGKQVRIELDLRDARTDSRAAEAIDLAVVHVVRNAVDHGIEPPDVRERAGKGPEGLICVKARDEGGNLDVTIEDDGGGIDVAAVRQRAMDQGLLDVAVAATASDQQILELLFRPGFSTRAEVTEVSGRGIGMDAARAALLRLGGSIDIATCPGRGSTVSIRVPAPVRKIEVYQFVSPGAGIALAVSARWSPSVESPAGRDAIDPLRALGLIRTTRQTGVSTRGPRLHLALQLRWGFLQTCLRAASAPTLLTAERVCPTPEDHVAEVVAIEGQEVLLLRPELLTRTMHATSGNQSRGAPAELDA